MAAPRRTQNRRLALLFAVQGSWVGLEFGVAFLAADESSARAAGAAGATFLLAVPWAYLAFVGTLDSPLARPFRGRAAGFAIGAAGLANASLYLLFPDRWLLGFGASPYWPFAWIPGSWFLYQNAFATALAVFSLAVAVSALRRAQPGSARRASARAYLLAFGVKDAFVFTAAGVFAFTIAQHGGWRPGEHAFIDASFVAFPVVYLLSMALLAYGVLRHQLFDIELRVKWSISRGTVAAAFVAAFIVAAQLAQNLLSESLGWLVGGVAAGLLLFALAPLQRAADRLADRAMPHVRDSDEYRTVRKRDVYRAAVESALQDGVVTDRERDMLATLQEKLGIAPTEAVRIEREVAGAST